MAGHKYLQTIVDDFTTLGGNWFNWSGGQAVASGGTLNITYPNANSSWGVDYTPDVSVSQVYYGVKLVTAPSMDTANRRITAILIQPSSGNTFSWRVSGGLANCWYQTGGGASVQVGSSITYDPAVHKYFAAGVNASNQLQWMWSTDGVTFTVAQTLANPYGTTAITSMSIYVFQNGTASGTPTAVFDDFSYWTPKPVKVNVRYGGATVLATPKVRIGGAWVPAVPKARSAGAWVEAY